MKSVAVFLRLTLIGGVIFLIPLVIVVAAVGKAFQIMRVVAAPLSRLIPIESVAGYAFIDVLAVIVMVLLCLIAGLVARSPWGRKMYAKLDELMLHMIPGYAWIKGVTGDISDDEAEATMKSVLARFDDLYQVGFEVDRTDDGLVVVYLPGAPDPRSGTLSYMTADRIQQIDAGFAEVSKSFKMLGRGAGAMLPGHLASG